MQNKPVYIYALTDPITDEIRYIGKSIKPKERLQNHMNDVSNCHRSHWLQSLKQKGLKPNLIILEKIIGEWPWQESEKYWIKKAKECGWNLTNNTSGGDGVCGLPEETRKRMAQVWVGRSHTEETKEKIRIAKTGQKHTEETKKKMSCAHRGRKITWGAKISEKARKLSSKDQKDILLKIKSGKKVKDLAAEYGVHRTTISKVKKERYLNG